MIQEGKPYDQFDRKARELFEKSVEARNLAYAPYSNFKVGAALRSLNDEIFTGCNVENVSYPLSTCAERTAIVKAVSQGCKKFDSAAISGILENTFVTPCGGCRQVLREFCDSNMTVYLVRPDKCLVYQTTMGALLPLSFAF